jgi:hypothetical protein
MTVAGPSRSRRAPSPILHVVEVIPARCEADGDVTSAQRGERPLEAVARASVSAGGSGTLRS